MFVLWRTSDWRNDGNRVFGKIIGSVHFMVRRRDGKGTERIDVRNAKKQFPKLKTTATQNIHVGSTVGYNFFVKFEDVAALFFGRVPCQKRLSIFWAHTVWIVVGRGWNGADVILVFFFVEEVRKVSFGKFFDPKLFGRVGQSHGNEFERID